MTLSTYPIEQSTALVAADLCLINLEVVRESTSLNVRECALLTATIHCELLEAYAKQEGADPLASATATELRSTIATARRYLDGDLN